ncbi:MULTISPECIES: cardiolipin synthase [unclassified Paraburkholderia]|uniref:cardiolipin synthase n=1 Tax=unclassified Paraburkholderia TaxID=2615204 RepID=UPI00160C67B2|nr:MULTISPECIES: cardiolipin synthase [unclassified Paraburkholderia]MBB5442177.1 cardiolipin synthase [Paraburkholderia sp. WSM4177]MBB5483014.1 cardiolipin synthase [Paraburkholderia sp. WSM4180]
MTIDLLHVGPLVLLAHILGIIAAAHAILHTRTSQGAIAWAVSLVAMPYLTLVPYLFLGRSKFAGYADARRVENELLRTRAHPQVWDTQASSAGVPTQQLGSRLVHSLTRLGGMPFLPGNTVRTLVNGTATFEAIFEAIENARRYVIVQFFIVRDDALGDMLKDALIAKAKQGVRVYFLYDSIGSFDLPHRYVAALRAAGIEMQPFATNRRFVNRLQLNFRNHRKIVAVDGERAFVGGHNVGVEYLGAKPPLSPWRDTHIEVRGPAVASIQFVFIEDWYWATQQLPEFDAPAADSVDEPADAATNERAANNMHCLVLPSGPADKQETCSLFFVEAINAARERIWITTPYLVPDEAVFAALRLAALRGVDVRILIPSRRDHLVVFAASKLYAYDSLRAGIRIFRYQPGFLHQKVVLIDSSAAAIGSANLDNRSFRLNFEIMVLTVDRGFALEVETMLLDDFAESREIDRDEYRKSNALRRMLMHVARLFSPIL